MAVVPLKRRVGLIEIKNKERKIQEELKARKNNEKEEKISEEDHQKRIDLLKKLGLVKDNLSQQ